MLPGGFSFHQFEFPFRNVLTIPQMTFHNEFLEKACLFFGRALVVIGILLGRFVKLIRSRHGGQLTYSPLSLVHTVPDFSPGVATVWTPGSTGTTP